MKTTKNKYYDDGNLEYIRKYYDDRAKRGAKVRYMGKYVGTITGAYMSYLIIDFGVNDPKHGLYYHPSWQIEYIDIE